MKKLIFFVFCIGVVFLFFKVFQTNQTSSNQPEGISTTTSNQDQAPVQKIVLIDKKISEDTITYGINLVYPQASGLVDKNMQEKVNKIFQDYAENLVKEFKTEIAGINDIPTDQKSELRMDYDILQLSRQMISLKFNVSNYTAGAAHPNSFVHAITYDLVSDKAIAGLEDIFESEKDYLKVLSDLSRENLKGTFADDFASVRATVEEGTLPEQKNFSEFGIARGTFNLYFNPYQVAPYAVGVVEVKIPYDQLHEILRDDFIFKDK
jgi:hypothetical protein